LMTSGPLVVPLAFEPFYQVAGTRRPTIPYVNRLTAGRLQLLTNAIARLETRDDREGHNLIGSSSVLGLASRFSELLATLTETNSGRKILRVYPRSSDPISTLRRSLQAFELTILVRARAHQQ
jgi:hypothetical protein